MTTGTQTLERMPGIDELHADAAATTGLSDFGNDDYREALSLLIEGYERDPYLTPECRARCYQQMLGALAARLRSEAQWKRLPQALRQPVRAPIILAGMSRTGTTALHKLLAVDPQFQVLEFWIGNAPMPRPPRSEWSKNPDYLAASAYVDEFYRGVPDFMLVHDMKADAPEEDRTLLIQDFAHLLFMDSAWMLEYDRWVERQPLTTAYRRMADNLRLIGLNDQRRWLLKDPMHLAHMQTLLATFPDARIVQTHRHPRSNIASQCSLIHIFRRYYENPDNDPKLIGPRKLDYWSAAMNRTLDVRKRHPDNFLDIFFGDIVADPLMAVRRVYEFCELELTPSIEAAMEQWIKENPKDRHGAHRPRLEDFGVSADRVDAAFERYLEEYRLPVG